MISESVLRVATLNIAAVFSIVLIPTGLPLGANAALWDILAAVFLVLPLAFAVQTLAGLTRSATSLYDVVLQAGGKSPAAFVVLCEWITSVAFTVPILEFAAVMARAVVLTETTEAGLRSGEFLAVAISTMMVIITVWQQRGLAFSDTWLVVALVGNLGSVFALLIGALMHGSLPSSAAKSYIKPEAASVLFGMTGIELSSFYLREAGPMAYQGAVGVSVVACLFLYAAGHIALASLVQESDRSPVDCMLQALTVAAGGHGVAFRFMAALLTLGSFASAIPWLIGPVRGLAQLVGAGDEWRCIILQNTVCAAIGGLFLTQTPGAIFWWLIAGSSALAQAGYLTIYWTCWFAPGRNSGGLTLLVGASLSTLGLLLSLLPPLGAATPVVEFSTAMLGTIVVTALLAYLVPWHHPETPYALCESGETCSLSNGEPVTLAVRAMRSD